MFKIGDKIEITQSNGLVLRDNPNIFGTVIKNIPNTTEFIVVDVAQDSLLWLQVEFETKLGWIAAGDNAGHVNAKILPKPKKRRHRKAKETA